MYIRTRLALWFMFILAVVLAAFSVAIYQFTRSYLLAEIDRDVRQRATLLAAAVEPVAADQPLRHPQLDVFTTPDVFLQVMDENGIVTDRSSNLEKHSLPLIRDRVDSGRTSEVTVGNSHLVLCGRAVRVNNRLRGYVLVARSPRTIYLTLDGLGRILLPGVIIALVLAGVAIWLLVRQAMRPLGDLARVATEIAATRDHSRRLLAKGPPDEIKQVAQIINSMLASLEDAYQQVQKVNDLQRHFLVDVSHELRAPLTIMLSSLDLMRKVGASDPDFQASALAGIRQEAERMARMVSQLLILARSDATVSAAYEPVLIGDVLTEVCRTNLQSSLERDGPILECWGMDELNGALVWGNRDYLQQLFLILLDNAFKYTSQGTVEVRCTQNEQAITITVADTGIGIAPDDLPMIFERFYRGGNARTSQGAGLGLAIARRIVEQHHGEITVESEAGKGSRFIVVLPVLDDEQVM